MGAKTQKLKIQVGFIQPMKRAGFVPKEPDFLSLLEEELTSYGEADLKEAASHIIRTRTFSTYPTLGEIIEALNHVLDSRLPGATRERLSDGLEFEKRKLARRRACQRIRCTSLADPANKEGWLHGLIDFVAEHDRMPTADEQASLKWTAEAIREGLAGLAVLKPPKKVRGWITLGGSTVTPALKKLRAAMMKKAEREVFGELELPKAPAADPYAEAMAAVPDR